MISSTNRWSNRENESEVGTVPEILCKSQTKELARMVGISRVCN